MGASVNIGVEYSLQAGTATGADGVAPARSDTYGKGTGLGVTVAYEGLTLGAYGAERENKNPDQNADVGDEFNGSWFVNYSFGPVSVGYQETYFDAGVKLNANDMTTTSAKSVGLSGGLFTGEAMSIAFNVNGAYDETYPRAYEENSDAGGQSSLNSVGNWADDNAIIYKAPALDLMGASVSIGVEHSLQAGTGTGSDGVAPARSSTYGKGTGLGVTVAYEGLTLGAYGAERENKNPTKNGEIHDEFNGSWFANYNFGPVSIGYQETYFDAGMASQGAAAPATTAAKSVGLSSGIFYGEAMSIAFNVNDNLSISYSETEDTYDAQGNTAVGVDGVDDTKSKTESVQVAYTMGSMSINAYSTEISNPNYDSDADNLNVNEIAIGLAF
jgi:hypothetical protein